MLRSCLCFTGTAERSECRAQVSHSRTVAGSRRRLYAGIPGVKGITDAEGTRNGWQKNPGEVGDRDLKFFDAALELAQKKYKTDPNRVYVLGHSNGGRFVNVLWNMRGDKLAALCSAAGPGGRLIEKRAPKPVFIIAGEKDPLVPFQTQQNSIESARKLLEDR